MDRHKITLVGGGLAGMLLATYLSKRGFVVEVFERRPDMRKEVIPAGRSINLALSARGIHALREVGLYDQIMRIAIPMRGRMIHPVSGSLSLQRYGKDDSEVIYAVSRALLNTALLDAADSSQDVMIHFNERCTGMDFRNSKLYLQNERTGTERVLEVSTVIGTDGSASAIRTDMENSGLTKVSQEQLDYGYKELMIPSGSDGDFRMDPNALHIWPRTMFMLIALPNTDHSFTCTFFYPLKGEQSFASLEDESGVHSFFSAQFPDAVPMMPCLLEDFFTNPTGTMVTVKCSPWHSGGTALLLGDAAHAIVPFFGQGMNAAFEDCTWLNVQLGNSEPNSTGWENVFKGFEERRKVNTDAIADLAIENFVEMRDLVATPQFQLKRKLEQALQSKYPDVFIPKYSMVTFHRLPYSIARERGMVQDRILAELAHNLESPEGLDWELAESLIEKYLRSLPLLIGNYT